MTPRAVLATLLLLFFAAPVAARDVGDAILDHGKSVTQAAWIIAGAVLLSGIIIAVAIRPPADRSGDGAGTPKGTPNLVILLAILFALLAVLAVVASIK